MSTSFLIELNDIRKHFQVGSMRLDILNGVTFGVAQGDLVSVMGTSGSGKSTLMNILGMLDRPSSGTYRFDRQDVGALDEPTQAGLRNRRIGFVFQQFNLLPRLSARDNVALPLLYSGIARREAQERASTMLESVGMKARGDHRPNELSGGQQQRVAIARALAGTPAVIFADEPTGALDSRVGQEIMDMFIALNEEQGTTLVIITHDPRVAAQCKRRLVMSDGLLVSDETGEN